MDTDVLIFTKNRAAQLDLLLRSIERYAPRLYRSVTVLAYPTTAEYALAYVVGRREWVDRFWTQSKPEDFETLTREWFDLHDRRVSFLVDDAVFYRPAPRLRQVTPPFSLRGGDYDYPFSLDGNIYERAHVRLLLDDMPPFRNPSELEAFGHELRHLLPFDFVNPCQPACLVGIPANRVSESSGMPHMGIDEKELNDDFLDGMRLALPDIDRDLPAHAYISYDRMVR